MEASGETGRDGATPRAATILSPAPPPSCHSSALLVFGPFHSSAENHRGEQQESGLVVRAEARNHSATTTRQHPQLHMRSREPCIPNQ
ncbi:hypothetical protein EYF80_061524 [Liparis tanakae]|uniref:Uncharacterized protein n=1 Tax=Liparis tanakae TaxID=230148 RepID=A0A4Z2EHN1_9TELE|nr:hypothetical protein EYF80_061524 [Liparis tanakae]